MAASLLQQPIAAGSASIITDIVVMPNDYFAEFFRTYSEYKDKVDAGEIIEAYTSEEYTVHLFSFTGEATGDIRTATLTGYLERMKHDQ